jgi:DNA-binding CsgD family transcriptional regulator
MSAESPYPLQRSTDDLAWTPRQREVFGLLARGLTNAQIASELGISLDGAKYHVSEVMSKLGVETREEAAEYWRAYNGWPRRLKRFAGGIVTGITLRWAGFGFAAVVLVGMVAVVAVVILQEGEERQAASPDDEVTPGPTVPVDENREREAERWGNFVLYTDPDAIEQVVEIPAPDLDDFPTSQRTGLWSSPATSFVVPPDDHNHWKVPWIESRPPGMDFLLGVTLSDGLRTPESAIAYVFPEELPDEGTSIDARRDIVESGKGLVVHASLDYALPVYVEVADRPVEVSPGLTEHPAEKVQVLASPAMLWRYEGSEVDSGLAPLTKVAWFRSGVYYTMWSPFDVETTMALVIRVNEAALHLEPHPDFEAHPYSVRTGEPGVDAILAAIEERDIPTLASRLRFVEEPCVADPEGLGAPPTCPEGVADGTPIEVFPGAACHGWWANRDDTAQLAQGIIGTSFDGQMFVHSVIRQTENGSGSHGIVLVTGHLWTVIISVHDGEIIHRYDVCRPNAVEMGRQRDHDYLLPPPSWGPFAYVSSPDGCLLVRDAPSHDATPIDCYDDGQALRDLGERVEADGRTWMAVQTLSGYNGWAAEELLVR